MEEWKGERQGEIHRHHHLQPRHRDRQGVNDSDASSVGAAGLHVGVHDTAESGPGRSDSFRAAASSSSTRDTTALKQELRELQARAEAVVAENESLHRTLEESMQQNEGATQQDLSQIRLLMQEVGILTKDNSELKSQLKAAQASAKNHLQEAVSLNDELLNRTVQLQKLEAELKEVAALKWGSSGGDGEKGPGVDVEPSSSRTNDASAEALTVENAELRQQLQHLMKEKSGTGAAASLPKRLDDAERRADDYHRKTQHLERQLKQSQEEVEQLQRQRRHCDENREAMQETITALNTRIADMERDKDDLRGRLEATNRMFEDLRQSRTEAVEARQRLEEEHASLKMQHAQLRTSVQGTIETESTTAVRRVKGELQQMEETLVKREEAIASLTYRLEQTQQTAQDLRAELEATKAAPQEQVRGLQDANNNLVRSLSEAQQARDDYKLKCEMAESQAAALQEEQQRLRQDHMQQSELQQERLRVAQHDNEQLQSKLREVIEERAALESQLSKADAQRQEAQQAAAAEVETLRAQLKRKESQWKARLEHAQEMQRKTLSEADGLMATRQKHASSLVEDARVATTRVEQELAAERQRAQELEAKTRTLRRALSKANDQVEAAQQIIDDDAAHIEHLQRQLRLQQNKYNATASSLQQSMQREAALETRVQTLRVECERLKVAMPRSRHAESSKGSPSLQQQQQQQYQGEHWQRVL